MIVFAADLHLSPGTWAKFPNLLGDAYCSFQQIINYCCKEKAQALVLGGDIFDRTRPDSASVAVFMEGMRILEKRGIRVLGVQGQHERAEPPWTSLVGNVTHLDGKPPPLIPSVACDGATILMRGIDNTSAVVLKAQLEADAAGEHYDILVLHQAMEGLVFSTAWNFTREWVPDFVHIVLLGDIHKAASEGNCHYSGSTNIRAIDESPHKSFIVVRHDGEKLIVEREKLETRDVLQFVITDEASRDAAVDELKAYTSNKRSPKIATPLVVARIAPEVPSAFAYLDATCAACKMFLDVRDLQVPTDVDKTAPTQSAAVTMEGLVGECVESMQLEGPNDKTELQDFAVRLLQSKDPSDGLHIIKKEMGVTSETG